jgi:thioredoxin 1
MSVPEATSIPLRTQMEELMSQYVKEVTDQDFEREVLKSDVPVLVDFWAPWCAPCRMLAPTVDQLASEYAGRAKVVKLNVDDNQETSFRYNIRGIPTLLLFKNGEVRDQIVGATSKENIARLIDAQLS